MPAVQENFRARFLMRLARHQAVLSLLAEPGVERLAAEKVAAPALTGAIWAVTIIEAGKTLNGETFPPEVLKEAAPLFEGVPIYTYQFGGVLGGDLHHLSKEAKEKNPEGFAGNYVGQIKNVRWEEAVRALVGEAHIDDERVRVILKNQFERDPASMLGLSIDADGIKLNGVSTKLTRATSVDIVTYPAAGGSFDRMLAEVIAASVTAAPWDGDKGRFTIEQLAAAVPQAVREWAAGQAKAQDREVRKSDLKLPFREPDGTVNINAVRAALAALGGARGGVDLPAKVRDAAKGELADVLAKAEQTPASPAQNEAPAPEATKPAPVVEAPRAATTQSHAAVETAAHPRAAQSAVAFKPPCGGEVKSMLNGRIGSMKAQIEAKKAEIAKMQQEAAVALKEDAGGLLAELAGLIKAKLEGDGAAWPEAAKVFLKEIWDVASMATGEAAMGACPGIVVEGVKPPAAAPAPTTQSAPAAPPAPANFQQAAPAPASFQQAVAPAAPPPVSSMERQLSEALAAAEKAKADAAAQARLAIEGQEALILRRELETIAKTARVADVAALEALVDLKGVTINVAGKGSVTGLKESVERAIAAHPILVEKPEPAGQAVPFQESIRAGAGQTNDAFYGRWKQIMAILHRSGPNEALAAEAKTLRTKLHAQGYKPGADESSPLI